ncbi:MAG: hypothetical protein M1827_003218 [Pycnora praestabilis]|nr:MAG: hypothetical protein M1827_003218 [Pycnora praestabilis]
MHITSPGTNDGLPGGEALCSGQDADTQITFDFYNPNTSVNTTCTTTYLLPAYPTAYIQCGDTDVAFKFEQSPYFGFANFTLDLKEKYKYEWDVLVGKGSVFITDDSPG